MWRANKSTTIDFAPWGVARPETRRNDHDDSRRHALNYVIGVTGMSAVAIVVLWWFLHRAGLASVEGLTTGLPMALAAGVLTGCWQLIRYTREYREWLYAVEAAEATETPKQKREMPLPGTLLRGADGVFQRVTVALSEAEIAALKALLLRDGACSVRVLTPLVGDRASALRQELHRIGILDKLSDRSATRLTAGGKKAVEKW